MSPVYTSHQKHNSEVLRDILQLFAKPGQRIFDMTYGEGAFWRGIDTSQYDLVTNDLMKDNPSRFHYDFRKTKFEDANFNIIVLDPPYQHGSKTVHASLAKRYGLNALSEGSGNGWDHTTWQGYRIHKRKIYPYKNPEKFRVVDVLETSWGSTILPPDAKTITQIYRRGMAEAWRLLKPQGILIVKTQDEIESGKQTWRHSILARFPGFKQIDLFVVTQKGKPLLRQKRQHHARKNHSYFLVLQRKNLN